MTKHALYTLLIALHVCIHYTHAQPFDYTQSHMSHPPTPTHTRAHLYKQTNTHPHTHKQTTKHTHLLHERFAAVGVVLLAHHHPMYIHNVQPTATVPCDEPYHYNFACEQSVRKIVCGRCYYCRYHVVMVRYKYGDGEVPIGDVLPCTHHAIQKPRTTMLCACAASHRCMMAHTRKMASSGTSAVPGGASQ